MRRSGFSLVTLALGLGLALTLITPALAQDENPSTDTQTQPPPKITHQAAVDLSKFEQPVLTLSNRSEDAVVELRLLALDDDSGTVRDFVIHLEAGGSTDLSLAAKDRFDYLSILADGAFTSLVEDAAGLKVRKMVEVVDLTAPASPLSKSTEQVCGGDWTLTCISPSSCSYQATHAGEVYLETPHTYLVYWNLNQPIGSWTTIGAGNCVVSWSRDFWNEGCPKTAYNHCTEETYLVTGAFSMAD